MNILRRAALVGISTLVLSACANNPYASPRESAHHGGYKQGVYVQHPQAYQSQPRVIVVQQPHRQIYSQGSRIYTQPHQVQQYNYYPGHQHQQRPQQYQHPGYSQQPKYNKYRDTRPQHQRPNHQRYEQYQRPDYSAQHRQNRSQRIQMRETWSQNRERISQQPKRQYYQKNPRQNQHGNYGSGIRQQRSERY